MDATEYKHVVLGLICLQSGYVFDKFEEHRRRLTIMNLVLRSVESGLIDGIVALSDRPFYSTRTPARVWISGKHRPAAKCRGPSEPTLTA
jgi:type I restriction-modification system DNA methylase subunit